MFTRNQTTSGSIYANTPLDPTTSLIRLLEILDHETITCTKSIQCGFRRVHLEDAPAYTALSYTWGAAGSAKEAKKVLIDGQWIIVRRNLWDFFQRMRRNVNGDEGRRWRFLWIDALCIDQENSAERNHQVSMMSAIYSSAEIVTVWLGEGADDSDLAMRYIEKLGKEPVSARRPCNWKQGKAVYALTERRYWTRIWIIQEVMLGKDILVVCGQRSVPWSCFSSLLEQLRNLRDYGRMEHVPFAWPVFGSAALRIVLKREAWKSLPADMIGLPIEEVLVDFADLQSTEPKDKVYALLGIISPFEDGSSISVDYSKTSAAIYRDVLRHVFFYNTSLDLPAKQQFKKLLKRSLGLGVMNVMEREPATEARILIAAETCAHVAIKSIEKQAVEHFYSREGEWKLHLQAVVEETAEFQGRWIAWKLAIDDRLVTNVIHTTAIKPETKALLETMAKKERAAAMNLTEPTLSTALQDHLKDACELGVETTMRWAQESRFEVESDHDKALDSTMEIRMLDLLKTQIENCVKKSVQSAIDSALESAQTLAAAQIRLEVRQWYGVVNERWRREYIATWVCKWQRREIEGMCREISEEDRKRIDNWIDGWYWGQVDDVFSRMAVAEIAKTYLVKRNQGYGNQGDYSLRWYLSWLFDYPHRRVQGVILRCIRAWHLRQGDGGLDLASAEVRVEIKEKVEDFLRARYPMPGTQERT